MRKDFSTDLNTKAGPKDMAVPDWVAAVPNAFGGLASRNDDGSTTVGVLRIYSTGLIVETEIDEQSWIGYLRGLSDVKRKYQWMLADLLHYGLERKYGETHEQEKRIAEMTGYSPDTLRDLASLAGKYEISFRNEILDLKHHKLCASLPQDKREYWLTYAVDNNLSAVNLEAAMNGIEVVDPTPLDVFHKRWHTFSKSQRRLAKIMNATDRATMARDLRALAKEIDRMNT